MINLSSSRVKGSIRNYSWNPGSSYGNRYACICILKVSGMNKEKFRFIQQKRSILRSLNKQGHSDITQAA